MFRRSLQNFLPAVVVIFVAILGFSCDDFVSKDTGKVLKEYESGIYKTLSDITAGDKSLAKGTRIKIRVRYDKEWVKVYGVPADISELLSDQVLILYQFRDKFEKEKFNKEIFDKELFGKIQKISQ